MTLKVFHFSTKAEQIETQCGAAVWQEPARGGGETDNRYTHLTSSSLASGENLDGPFCLHLFSASDKLNQTGC